MRKSIPLISSIIILGCTNTDMTIADKSMYSMNIDNISVRNLKDDSVKLIDSSKKIISNIERNIKKRDSLIAIIYETSCKSD